MSTHDFLEDLRRRKIRVWADDGQLRLSVPKGGMTPELKERIAQRKADILQYLAAQDAAGNGLPPITKAPRDRPLVTSFGQERLWFLHQIQPSAVYNLQINLPFKCALDREALERTLGEVFRRHEVLRTTFDSAGGQPHQVVRPPAPVRLREVRLDHLPEADRETEATKVRAAEGKHTFDLVQGPLTRVVLLSFGGGRHELVLTQHHIATDGWSMAILVEEILTLYAAFSRGKPTPLPELEVQYADFAHWQRGWLRGEVLEREVDQWRHRLAGAPVLELPTDRPRPPLQTFEGALQAFELPSSLSQDVRRVCTMTGATPFVVLLAAFKALLSRYSGQTDVVVGTSNGNRSRPEIEPLVGFFVNTQVLRTDLSGDPSFREVIERVREVCLDALSRQDVPFEKLVAELHVERDLSRTPLFQVMFILQNTPLETIGQSVLGGRVANDLGAYKPDTPIEAQESRVVSVRGGDRKYYDQGTSKFDLTLYLVDTMEGLRGSLEYNTDLFEHTTAARLLNHYETVLRAVLADPDLRLSKIPVLTEPETEQLLGELNPARIDTPALPCVHELVDRQAERNPTAVAAELGSATLTYGELARRSDRLAELLREMGVGRGDLVGIFVERSLEMVVGLLGVLKAGAAYVPLDPAYPRTRLAFMLADSQASVVLTQTRLADNVPGSDARRLCLDAVDWTSAPTGGHGPKGPAGPMDRAYVIYTSGSTGTPKGVEIPHRALSNFLLSMREEPGFDERDTLLAVTTLSFDIAGLELYLPLVAGGRVVLATREQALDGNALADALRATGATVMQATPATWRLLVETGWVGSPGLKALSGGEALPRDLADEILRRTSELWNLYGPTETTIWSTVERVVTGVGPVLVGRPIANTEAYVLDASLNLVPIGVAGELYLGGAGLALGYLNRPELTAERFVSHPFATGRDARLYRTGDRARYREDGRIEYLGRVDQQVKLRGFRIELGEVEAALNQQDGVREAVAAVHERSASDRRLVAYVIPDRSPPPEPKALREGLATRLPEYMLPSLFHFLDELPLTPNGKVDRKRLPEPEPAQAIEGTYTAPRDNVEETVAEIWRKVLGRDRIGITDNFFDLGGHSLLLATVHRELQDRLGGDLTIIDLFEHPTVESLSRRAAGRGRGTSSLTRAKDRAARREVARGGRDGRSGGSRS